MKKIISSVQIFANRGARLRAAVKRPEGALERGPMEATKGSKDFYRARMPLIHLAMILSMGLLVSFSPLCC